MSERLPTLTENLKATVFQAIGFAPPHKALVVFDRRSTLSALLTDAYQAVLPEAKMMDFDAMTPGDAREAMNALSPGDLVVLVQSGSFRLNEFRFRLELFDRKLAVSEHPHLGRMPDEEINTYIDALAYDPAYYRVVGPKLKTAIDHAKQIVVRCDGTELVYDGPFESAKLNIGDYTGMKNIGGQFPIGEVFTEPAELNHVNGTVKLYAFADADFRVIKPAAPILVTIEKGMITKTENATPEFQAVLDQISEDEALWVRELGFGMNRAMTKQRTLVDIGSYERMCGVHLSLGAKHTIYTKAGFPKKRSRYHVDVFVDVTSVTVDGEVLFQDGAYRV